jgi:hypothetical protein
MLGEFAALATQQTWENARDDWHWFKIERSEASIRAETLKIRRQMEENAKAESDKRTRSAS